MRSGAELRDRIHDRLADTVHVPVDAFVQVVQQLVRVVLCAQAAKQIQSAADTGVAIARRAVLALPRGRTGLVVVGKCGKAPSLVAAGTLQSRFDFSQIAVGIKNSAEGFAAVQQRQRCAAS